MPTKEDLARIWAKTKPAVRIGKSGLDTGVVEEIKRQLQRKKLIKVKFLHSIAVSEDIDALATQLAEQTSSEVWGRRGFVVILAHRKP